MGDKAKQLFAKFAGIIFPEPITDFEKANAIVKAAATAVADEMIAETGKVFWYGVKAEIENL
jgi:hypothetical protein